MTSAPADRPPQRLREFPSWLISHTALHAQRLVAERFAATGVRKHHFGVLAALEESGPASQAALGRRLSIDRSDMAATVNDLEGMGLIRRVRDEHDRRCKVVQLTPAGGELLERLGAELDEAQRALVEPLSASERDELVRLLTRLIDHHGTLPKASDEA